jgi:hypothetical protein
LESVINKITRRSGMRHIVFVMVAFGFLAAAICANATPRMVLGEMYTNYSCAPCSAANYELDRFAPLHPNLAVIRYHTWWPGSSDPFWIADSTENRVRTNYYQPGSKYVPRLFIDGIIDGQSNYGTWEGLVNGREAVDSPLDMLLTGTYNPMTRVGTATAYIEATKAVSLTSLKLQFVITESKISLNAPNGQTIFHEVMRDMINNANGEAISISSPGDTLIRRRPFNIAGTWTDANCSMIVFVQSDNTKEVLQAAIWNFKSVKRDVGADSIVWPPDTVLTDSSYAPVAWAHNYGDTTAAFRVECSITPGGYADTFIVVSLAKNGNVQCPFAPWTVPSNDSTAYTVSVKTHFLGDTITVNDSASRQVFAVRQAFHDVGTDSITSPGTDIVPDSSYNPVAWIHNFGTFTENFFVECMIPEAGYGDTFVVMGMAPSGNAECTFDSWTVPSADSTSYTVCVRTVLPSDQDATNDSLCKGMYAVIPTIHDAGVDSITSPPDTIQAGSSYPPIAWIRNNGDFPETFAIVCRIDSSGTPVYSDTGAAVGLAPGADYQVSFSSWSAPAIPGVTYNTCVWTILTGDAVPSNDTLCKTSFSVTWVEEKLDSRRAPSKFILYQGTPNPFSRLTTFSYEIPSCSNTELSIYDATGRLVRTLFEGDARPGIHSADWNGRNETGAEVPGGIYFCKLSAGRNETTVKMVLVR